MASFSRTLLILAVCVLVGAQQSKSGGEKWSLWQTIESGYGGRGSLLDPPRPPWADEFRTEVLAPTFLSDECPVVDGRVILVRGAVIEAWDLAQRKLAWKLLPTSGMMGWTLEERTVAFVLPEGPAARAGVTKGDVVLAVDGKPFAWWTTFRAGQTVVLDLLSAGGVRQVTVEARVPPEPYGVEPKVIGLVGDDFLLERSDRIERLRTADGHIVWSRPAGYLTHGKEAMLLTSEGRLVAVDLVSGTERWNRPLREGIHSASWTDAGPLVTYQADSGVWIDRLDPAKGEVAWSFASTNERDPHLDVFPAGQVLITTFRCAARGGGGDGSIPTCNRPVCARYWLVELQSGRILWHRWTGSRRHGGSDRHGGGGTFNAFDPLSGGPVKAVGDRLLSFDVRHRTLSVIDPATAREEHSVKLPVAWEYSSFAPSGFAAINNESGSDWINLSSGHAIHADLPHEHFVCSGAGIFGYGGVRLARYELKEQALVRKWERGVPEIDWRGVSVCGDRLLVRSQGHSDEQAQLLLLDAVTGRELWSTSADNPTFWTGFGYGREIWDHALSDPFIIVITSKGVHIFGRDDAEDR